MNPLIQLKQANSVFFIAFGLACFAQAAQAVSPPPDGGYPGGNTAEGQAALLSLTTGGYNTAVGFLSLRSNTTNQLNTAIGAGTLFVNTADENTATGAGALFSNTTGPFNTATGALALFSNTIATFNSAFGQGALLNNTTGNNNTASGAGALFNNTMGGNNTAIGFRAGQNLTTGDNNIDIGNEGFAGEANTIRIGDQATQTFTVIAGISNDIQAVGTPVIVTTDGVLGVATSSARFKDEIKPMDKASEAILALRPVSFHYKKEIDPKHIPQFGLVAEEVEKVNPALVVRDAKGDIYTVRYDAVNAMLLNEFLKAHRRMEAQDKRIDELTEQLKQQAAQIQKVSTQLEVSKPAPQTVLNNQ